VAEARQFSQAIENGPRQLLGINSEGWDVPPFLVVQGKNHLANWYTEGGLPPRLGY